MQPHRAWSVVKTGRTREYEHTERIPVSSREPVVSLFGQSHTAAVRARSVPPAVRQQRQQASCIALG